MCTRTALLLFISCHLLNWEWQGLAEADNELGVETVRAKPCRRGHCSPEWLKGQSVSQCIWVWECVSRYKNSLRWYFNEIIPKLLPCHVGFNCFYRPQLFPLHVKPDGRCLSKSHSVHAWGMWLRTVKSDPSNVRNHWGCTVRCCSSACLSYFVKSHVA